MCVRLLSILLQLLSDTGGYTGQWRHCSAPAFLYKARCVFERGFGISPKYLLSLLDAHCRETQWSAALTGSWTAVDFSGSALLLLWVTSLMCLVCIRALEIHFLPLSFIRWDRASFSRTIGLFVYYLSWQDLHSLMNSYGWMQFLPHTSRSHCSLGFANEAPEIAHSCLP